MPLPFLWQSDWSQAELAVLAIVGRKANRNGACDLSGDRIAKLAGTSLSVVRSTLRAAERYGLVSIEQQRLIGQISLPNLVRIDDPAWRKWLSLSFDARQDRMFADYNREFRDQRHG